MEKITNEIVELLNQVMQNHADNDSVKFFQVDGKWYFMDDVEDIHETNERTINIEIEEQWEYFLEGAVYRCEQNYFKEKTCVGNDCANVAYYEIIKKYTDYEETEMEKLMYQQMTNEQRANVYRKYIEQHFPNAIDKLQIMTN